MATAFTLMLAYLGEECSATDAAGAFAAYITGNVASNLFGRLMSVPGVYDGLHFAELRTGSRIARLAEHATARRAVPALRAELDRAPVDLVLSVFATGALSPVSIASFTLELPSMTTPSTGMLSPGRTTKTSPT